MSDQSDNKRINIKPATPPPGTFPNPSASVDRKKPHKNKASATNKKQTDEELKKHIIEDVLPRLQPQAPDELQNSFDLQQPTVQEKPAANQPLMTSTQANYMPQALPEEDAAATQPAQSSKLNKLRQLGSKTKHMMQGLMSDKASSSTENAAEEEISIKQWMLTILLFLIPGLNVIMAIIWIRSPKINTTQKNFAKAALLWICILVVAIFLIVAITMLTVVANL